MQGLVMSPVRLSVFAPRKIERRARVQWRGATDRYAIVAAVDDKQGKAQLRVVPKRQAMRTP